MSSPSRVFAILDLFTRDRPVWSPEEINEALGYSRPTGYRYVKELVDAGMLRKLAAGHYSLGGRIIELDYQLRQTDPVLLAAMPVMQRLAERSGLAAVLTVLFAGPRVIDIHRVSTDKDLELAYGRGRPRPVFRSAAPKILLAHLPRAQLVKIFETHAPEIQENGLGASWIEFRSALAEVRKRGFYRSAGELEPTLGSVAVPVLNDEDECVAALALVGRVEHIRARKEETLVRHLQEAAVRIRTALAAPAEPTELDSASDVTRLKAAGRLSASRGQAHRSGAAQHRRRSGQGGPEPRRRRVP